MILILSFLILSYSLLKELKNLKSYNNLVYKNLIIKHKSLVLQYCLVLLGIVILARAFKLKLLYLVLLTVLSILVFLHVLRSMNSFNQNYEETMQLILVMTHLSHQFKTHQKIEFALREVMEVCNQDTTDKLQLVLESIDHTPYQESFDTYHNHYLLKTLVTTMVHAQDEGDDHIMHALNLIEQDIDDLNNHIFLFIREMMALRNKILLLSCFGLIVTLVSQNMLNMVVDVSSLKIYQDIVFVFMATMMVFVGCSFNIMKSPLIMEEELLYDN